MTHPTPTPGAGEFPQLLPCPFCGSPASMIDRPDGPFLVGAFAGCDQCDIHTPILPFAAEAVAAWNRRAQAAPTAAWKFNALYADTEVRRVADDKLLAVIHPSSERLSIVNLLKGAATSHAIAPAPASEVVALTEDEIDAIESAFDYVFHFASDPKDGHIAQAIADTLQRLEHRLRGRPAALQSVKPKDAP